MIDMLNIQVVKTAGGFYLRADSVFTRAVVKEPVTMDELVTDIAEILKDSFTDAPMEVPEVTEPTEPTDPTTTEPSTPEVIDASKPKTPKTATAMKSEKAKNRK